MKQKNNSLNERIIEIGRSLSNINDLKEDFPFIKEINGYRDELSQNLNSISEKININSENQKLKEKEKELSLDIKEVDNKLKSVYERVGLEIYGTLENDYAENMEIQAIYNNLKKGEVETEGLERELYKYENSIGKKNILSPIINGIKLSAIKGKIESLNKKNLGLIQKLGLHILGNDELSESISEELLEDYKKFSEIQVNRKKSLEDLRAKIENNSKRLHELSPNIEIDLKNNKLEKQISELCFALGQYVLNEQKTSGYSIEVDENISEALKIKKEMEILDKKEELYSLKKNLEALTLDIQKKEENLKLSKAQKKEMQEKLKSIESWIELNSPSEDKVDN
jgi:hypothetical protein